MQCWGQGPMRGFRSHTFPRGFFCFSQIDGLWTPTYIPAVFLHHEGPPPSVPGRGELPLLLEAPSAFLLCAFQATLTPGGWGTTACGILSPCFTMCWQDNVCPPCLPGSQDIITQLFALDTRDTKVSASDGQSSRENPNNVLLIVHLHTHTYTKS